MITSSRSLALCFVLALVCGAGASPWATPEQEARDEENDAELLRAVYTSMEEYWLRRLSGGHRRKRAESVVCYGELGCFEDTGPFGYLDMLPSSPEEVGTKFQVYAGAPRGERPLLEVPYSNLSLLWGRAAGAFNASAPTKIIVHGFGSSCNHVWVYEMRSALMSVEDCNVFCVDWEAGALIPNYVRAVANTRLVGKQLAMLIEGLLDHGLTLDKVHLIGFSLGAHVAGFAGAELRNVSRITGLDPAGPLFESQHPNARLDETDASFVDVIHSNGENLILGGLGSWQPMGHVDFYPNGGRMQKGCTNLFVGAVSDIIWSASDIEGRSLCNHRRAYKFFTDSVSPRCHFPAFPCESFERFLDGKCFPCPAKQDCGSMGYYADKSAARGSLYLITREEEPFCAHQYHVRVESSPSKLPVLSYGRIQVTLIGDSVLNETFTLTKKDDDELGVGTALSRIVVPHPALQHPTALEITYTAYSGWISSGLKKWSVDKIQLSDSYGKSLSHCKKDLILESKVPVLLKLFPGDCNLPREPDAPDDIDPFFLAEPSPAPPPAPSPPPTNASTAPPPPSTTRVVDGFPAYVVDSDFHQTLANDSDSAESNKVLLDAVAPQEKNYTMRIIRRNEITEPILQPKSSGRNLQGEVDEPVLKAIAKVQIVERTTEAAERKSSVRARGVEAGDAGANGVEGNVTTQWTPPQEMYPPPLGWRESWDTTREPKMADARQPITLQSKLLRPDKGNKAKLHQKAPARFYASPGNSLADYPRNDDGSITVQLFPQHLAAILRQAEHYAKASFLGPFDAFAKARQRPARQPETQTDRDDSRPLETLATPRQLDSSPKPFLPKIYDYIEKGLQSVRSLFGLFHAEGGAAANSSATNSSRPPDEKFIPLSLETS